MENKFFLVKRYPEETWFATSDKKWSLDYKRGKLFPTVEDAIRFETVEMKYCFKIQASAITMEELTQ